MAPQPKVLLVEDSEVQARLILGQLAGQPYEIRHVTTVKAALAELGRSDVAAILLDLQLPDDNGLTVLTHAMDRRMPLSVIVATGNDQVATAVAAMRLGAFDYLVKPVETERLRASLRNAIERTELHRLVSRYRNGHGSGRFEAFIGASPAMQAVYRAIESCAPSTATVFITGESGTGKELCARAIHNLSPRRDKPLITLNCAAIPRELLESEIFGHVKGAFTGAIAERNGAAARADGGTLFLDEICEMPTELQSKLLRFVQSGSFQKVGTSRPQTVDVRFVCATNRDPWQEVQAGRFREDLYYRLHVIPIGLPALRDRGDDILVLAGETLRKAAEEESKDFARFAPDAEARLLAYPWPGNVRELQNLVRRIVVMNDGDTVTSAMIPPLSRDPWTPAPAPSTAAAPGSNGHSTPASPDGEAIQPLWQVEKQAIERAIAFSGGNVTRAARMLGINASTIYRKRLDWRRRIGARPA